IVTVPVPANWSSVLMRALVNVYDAAPLSRARSITPTPVVATVPLPPSRSSPMTVPAQLTLPLAVTRPVPTVRTGPDWSVRSLQTAPRKPVVSGWLAAGTMIASTSAEGTPALQFAGLLHAVEADPVQVVCAAASADST